MQLTLTRGDEVTQCFLPPRTETDPEGTGGNGQTAPVLSKDFFE